MSVEEDTISGVKRCRSDTEDEASGGFSPSLRKAPLDACAMALPTAGLCGWSTQKKGGGEGNQRELRRLHEGKHECHVVGVKVLSAVSRTYLPMKELWSLCKGLDAVVPRSVHINYHVPEPVITRLLTRTGRGGDVNRPMPSFPVIKACLGLGKVKGVGSKEWMHVRNDPTVAYALGLLAQFPPSCRLKELRFGDGYDSKVVFPSKRGSGDGMGLRSGPPHTVEESSEGRSRIFGKRTGGGQPWEEGQRSEGAAVALSPAYRIIFGESFNYDIALPEGVCEVEVGDDFDCDMRLPNGLRTLKLGDNHQRGGRTPAFPYSWPDIRLPNSEPYSSFGLGSFDRPVHSLPSSLKELTFGVDHYFEEPLRGLPAGLKILRFQNGNFDPASTQEKGYNHVVEKLPVGLEELELSDNFDHTIHFPPGLKKLKMGFSFNQPLGCMLSELEELILGSSFSHPLPPKLPTPLKVLKCGRAFSHSIPCLPAGLKVLVLDGDSFNDHLPAVPDALEQLRLGRSFNQPVLLPAGSQLKSVRFGDSFNRPVDLSVAAGLVEVVFGQQFNQPLGELPEGLKVLHFVEWQEDDQVGEGSQFNHPIELPAGIREVNMGDGFDQPLHLPPGVESVAFGLSFNQPIEIPAGVKRLTFGVRFRQPVHLPPGLEELTFWGSHLNRVMHLPSSLKKVKFGAAYNMALTLPTCVQKVIFGSDFNYPVVFPASGHLKSVTFGDYFDQPDVILPQGLEKLVFGDDFNQVVQLPDSVREVKFGDAFNQQLTLSVNVLKLTFGESFNQPVVLNAGLQRVTFGASFDQPVTLPPDLKCAEFENVHSHQEVSLPEGSEWDIMEHNELGRTYKRRPAGTAF